MTASSTIPPSVVRAPGAHAREAITLPRAIKARVNQLAHRSAQRHEAEVRASTLQDLERLAGAGSGTAALFLALADIEHQAAADIPSTTK